MERQALAGMTGTATPAPCEASTEIQGDAASADVRCDAVNESAVTSKCGQKAEKQATEKSY
ncbi:hypothetical protein [Caballeronia sp. BCC1704]|uniref:hypothetical protein n=1 Tax=Caballeronia sp. BCC1704 TaxID=2676300 RepID=UPI001588C439|nr:hypothetical protein [Caballeronia sp. BCC1704]